MATKSLKEAEAALDAAVLALSANTLTVVQIVERSKVYEAAKADFRDAAMFHHATLRAGTP